MRENEKVSPRSGLTFSFSLKKKMSDEWVLAQLDSSFILSTLKRMPEFASLQERAALYNFSCLTRDLKLMILSWCLLSDAKNIALVCREWNTFLDYPVFWEKHALKRLVSFDQRPIWMQRFKEIVRLPFNDDVNRRLKFGWLFGKWKVHIQDERTEIVDDFAQLTLKTNGNYELLYMFDPGFTLCDEYRVFSLDVCIESWLFTTNLYKGHFPYYKGVVARDGTQLECVVGYGIYQPSSSLVYEGEIRNYVPYGNGEWRFSDGSIFRGTDISFKDVPHGKGFNEKGEEVEYIAGHLKSDLDEAYLRKCKKRRLGE